jgi:hypothetical protein
MTDTPEPSGRPRTVDGAFYSWITGAIVTAAMGLLMISYPVMAYKLVGILLVLVGLALGFLAGRARKRDPRFARAALALAMSSVAFLALVLLFLPIPIGVLILIGVAVLALIAGSFLTQRPASQAWLYPDGAK